jgi:hypothetical protein
MNIINVEEGNTFLIRLAETRPRWRTARSLGTVRKWRGQEVRLRVEGIEADVFISPTQLHPYVGLLQDSALKQVTLPIQQQTREVHYDYLYIFKLYQAKPNSVQFYQGSSFNRCSFQLD